MALFLSIRRVKLLLLFLFTVLTAPLLAQTGQGRLTGSIADGSTQQALPFATVAVRNERDSTLLGGAQADEQGRFSVANLPAGRALVTVSFVGYQSFSRPVSLTDTPTDLGLLALQPDAATLREVKVRGEKDALTVTPEKRVFNVAKSLTTVGGTAETLLRNVPSITLDESGNPSLRNMATTIYVNGKPTQLTLAQIPANQIESVEVISNPSARYDASTSGGIVNLILKKNRQPGYTGIASVGIGSNSRYDATLNLDARRGKWNLTGLYSLNATKNPLNGYVHRTNTGSDGRPTGFFDQTTAISLNNNFQSGRLAVDFAANDHNLFSLAGTLVGGAFNTISNQEYAYRNASQTLTGSGTRLTVPHNDYVNTGLEFDYRHQFAQKGRELSLATSLTRNRVSNAADWLTTSLNPDGSPQPNYPERDRIDGQILGTQYLTQLDYVHPLSDSARWEAGLRSYTYDRDQQYFFNQQLPDNQAFLLLRPYSQDARITETVNAAYVLYGRQLAGRVSIQAGLRLEQSSLVGNSRLDSTTFGYHYPSSSGQNWFQALFPSFLIAKKLPGDAEISLSLSRKVGRPSFRHVFVGIQAADRQNITIGNPQVRPEFVNTAELNYNKSWGNTTWLASAYYIYEDHTIKPLVQPLASDPSVLVTTFVNVKADIRYGFDQTLKFGLGRDLSLLANVNLYDVILQSTTLRSEGAAYNAKLSLTYRLPANFTAQVSANRESRSPSLQGHRNAVQAADFALRKAFWQNRASVLFTINDVFNSRRFVSVYDQPGVYQASMNRRDVRFYKLTLQLPLGRSESTRRKERKMDRPDVDFNP